MSRKVVVYLKTVLIFLSLFYGQLVFAVPAAPVVHVLSQPDGTQFKARQWGDEWSNGWETSEGYSIVLDKPSKSWRYAEVKTDGSLAPSANLVGNGGKPSLKMQKSLRPTGQALKKSTTQKASSYSAKPVLNAAIAIEAEKSSPFTITANIPLILVNFNDTTTTYTANDFDALLFGSGNKSMKDYFEEVSYGAFSVSAGPAGVLGWYTASNGHDYYGQNNASGGDQKPGTLVYEAVAAADTSVDFSAYDQDGDCFVDVVNIVHQGSGEEAGGAATDIWSHRWSLSSAQFYGSNDFGIYTTNDSCSAGGNIKINDYVIQPEILWGNQHTVGVFVHEYGHALGLPDLYDTDYSSNGLGKWAVMSGGSWNGTSRSGDTPSHFSAWSKKTLGWVNPTVVGSALTGEQISQSATADDVYQFLNGSEYFLVENRQRTGFDAGLPGDGLAVWHIDSSKSGNSQECYPPSDCSSSHYKVALVQADGLWELEKKISSGNSGDLYPGSSNNLSFTSASTPSSNLYDGVPSKISITNISASGATMYADFEISANNVLSITKTGNGKVTSSPVGIDCGNDCSQSYTPGTVVTLTATPMDGWNFSGWGGACSEVGACVVDMSTDNNVGANFVDPYEPDDTSGEAKIIQSGVAQVHSIIPANDVDWVKFTLTNKSDVTLETDGTSGDTRMWLYNNSLTEIAFNDDVDFNSDSLFSKITQTALAAGTYYVKVDEYYNNNEIPSYTLAANIVPYFTLSLSKSGSGFGVVASIPSGINCGGDCAEDYIQNTQVTLTATPDLGSVFTGWSGGCSGTGVCQVTMSAAQSVTAAFFKDSDGADSENDVPNAAGSGTGDGDGDGVADILQSHVSSFQNAANNWLTYRNSGNFSQSDIVTATAPLTAIKDRYLSNGITSIRLTGFVVGTATTIDLFVTKNEAIVDYMMLGNDGKWYEMGATITHTGNKTRITFSVTEGGNFDTDSMADGVLNLAQGGAVMRTGFEISPYAHSFGLTELNTSTPNQTFTITNKGSRSLTFSSATVSGTYSNQFNIAADNCTSQTVAADASCTVDVNMQPTTVGSKSAWLEIASDDPDNSTTAAFLNNYESTDQQARRRLPPVLYSLAGLPETMTIGQSYTITWELLGYHENYLSAIVFFDCTGIAPPNCGNSYSSNFASSGILSPASTAVGEWSYKGVQSKRYSYSYTFTPTTAQFPAPADIVIRFYRKNGDDSAAGKGSLSLIIPGNLSDNYYDTSGRRIQKRVE